MVGKTQTRGVKVTELAANDCHFQWSVFILEFEHGLSIALQGHYDDAESVRGVAHSLFNQWTESQPEPLQSRLNQDTGQNPKRR